MNRLCEDRVAVVTGAARGVGRQHALQLAQAGAKVVVNDLGAKVDGRGADTSPAQQVVEEMVPIIRVEVEKELWVEFEEAMRNERAKHESSE